MRQTRVRKESVGFIRGSVAAVSMDGANSISLKVVTKVAEREGIAPEELEPPLHSAVDTEALDSIFRPPTSDREPVSIVFTYKGYTIRVDGPDEIRVSDQATAAESEKEYA